MNNPWLNLKDSYVLKNDLAYLGSEIEKDIPPQPYCGNINKSKILLLQLNPGLDVSPGFSVSNAKFSFKVFPNLKKDIIKNLKQEKMHFPFYHLNPEYRLDGGFRYWSRILKDYINNKESYRKLSNRIACLEYFPYHSKNYKRSDKLLESQKYTFSLLKKSIKKNIPIIVMRKIWITSRHVKKEMPELMGYKNLITLKNTMNPVITEKNLSKNNYSIIKEILS